MFKSEQGAIQEFTWGKFIINGKEHAKRSDGSIIGAGKDIRVIDGKVTSWKERNGHTLEKNMITGIFEKNIKILIIGNGVYGALKCPENVRKYIRGNGIDELIIKKTPEACKIYNQMYHSGKKCALLTHGTC